jgi:hypothetical protein
LSHYEGILYHIPKGIIQFFFPEYQALREEGVWGLRDQGVKGLRG